MVHDITKPVADSPESVPMLVSASKAAKMLGISPRHLWSLTKSGNVPCNRVGRRVMYAPALLQAWVASSAIMGGKDYGKHI